VDRLQTVRLKRLSDREVRSDEAGRCVTDPRSNLFGAEMAGDARAMILRLVDFLKAKNIAAMFFGLNHERIRDANRDISPLRDGAPPLKAKSGADRPYLHYFLKPYDSSQSNCVLVRIGSGERIFLRRACRGSDRSWAGPACVCV
jgi:hypothetical protein